MKKNSGISLIIIFSSLILLSACNSQYTPKPRGYYQISFPEHQYQVYNEAGCPFSFEYPVYAKIERDSSFFYEDQQENPCWINLDFPDFNGKIYMSYIRIGGTSVYKVKDGAGGYKDSVGVNSFDRLISSSYNLTYKHSYKATSIEDSLFHTQKGITGIFFRIGGNAATANQFLVTDTSSHFVRGALYFDAAPNEDSLVDVNQFLKQDMKHLINSFSWKK